jgi:hypothetical protein
VTPEEIDVMIREGLYCADAVSRHDEVASSISESQVCLSVCHMKAKLCGMPGRLTNSIGIAISIEWNPADTTPPTISGHHYMPTIRADRQFDLYELEPPNNNVGEKR